MNGPRSEGQYATAVIRRTAGSQSHPRDRAPGCSAACASICCTRTDFRAALLLCFKTMIYLDLLQVVLKNGKPLGQQDVLVAESGNNQGDFKQKRHSERAGQKNEADLRVEAQVRRDTHQNAGKKRADK